MFLQILFVSTNLTIGRESINTHQIVLFTISMHKKRSKLVPNLLPDDSKFILTNSKNDFKDSRNFQEIFCFLALVKRYYYYIIDNIYMSHNDRLFPVPFVYFSTLLSLPRVTLFLKTARTKIQSADEKKNA